MPISDRNTLLIQMEMRDIKAKKLTEDKITDYTAMILRRLDDDLLVQANRGDRALILEPYPPWNIRWTVLGIISIIFTLGLVLLWSDGEEGWLLKAEGNLKLIAGACRDRHLKLYLGRSFWVPDMWTPRIRW